MDKKIKTNKQTFVAKLAAKTGKSKEETSRFYNSFVDVFKEELATTGRVVIFKLLSTWLYSRKIKQKNSEKKEEIIFIKTRMSGNIYQYIDAMDVDMGIVEKHKTRKNNLIFKEGDSKSDDIRKNIKKNKNH